MTVELRQVRKAYGEVVAVRDATLLLPTGQISALLGPSGCGKTTILRLIAGFETPDAGVVLINGEPVAGGGAWVAPERRRVGMVFQQLALFPHLDVASNVGYGLAHMRRDARRARVAELLELVELQGYERRRPDELSGGQAQRVAVARALAPKPDVILLDEPFSGLDVSLRGDVRAEVRRILQAEGATALLVTHDQDEALSMGDQVAVMLDGGIAHVGSPEEVYRRPATAAVGAFFGDVNLLPATATGGQAQTALGPLAVEGAEGRGTALVRPEDLDLAEDPMGDGRVEAVEYFGHDQVVTVRLPALVVRARLHARQRLAVGAPVRVIPRGAYWLPGAVSD